MQYIYSDSFGGAYSLTLPFGGQDDPAKHEAAKAYRRSIGQTAGQEPMLTFVAMGADAQDEELAEAA